MHNKYTRAHARTPKSNLLLSTAKSCSRASSLQSPSPFAQLWEMPLDTVPHKGHSAAPLRPAPPHTSLLRGQCSATSLRGPSLSRLRDRVGCSGFVLFRFSLLSLNLHPRFSSFSYPLLSYSVRPLHFSLCSSLLHLSPSPIFSICSPFPSLSFSSLTLDHFSQFPSLFRTLSLSFSHPLNFSRFSPLFFPYSLSLSFSYPLNSPLFPSPTPFPPPES